MKVPMVFLRVWLLLLSCVFCFSSSMRLARFLVSIPIRILLVGLGGVLLFMIGFLGCAALLGSTSRVLSKVVALSL
ncbi:hypothetical protein Gogos_017981 [Gossypium gossypioides]|uniref:Transmembrane protein n=1 Tax=Gossypium gossypioides TaxID=34282 RepID=A0A7J9BCP5_GOSGO|nr:hypothetical protein [Gossypium gossypioides]